MAQPTHAERARTVVASSTRGTLSTLAVNPAGYPFGSLVAYALDESGHPLLLLSGLAEHTTNLKADPRASLFVTEPLPEDGDPLAHGRVTLLGDLAVAGDDGDDGDDGVRERYLDVHPEAKLYVDFPDFSFYRLTVSDVRYVGGFGRMSWASPEDFLAAEADPLAPSAADIVEHMNADHADALLDYCRGLAGKTAAISASMTGVDRYGFDVAAITEEGPEPVRIDFTKPLSTPDQVRSEMVRLVRAARDAASRP